MAWAAAWLCRCGAVRCAPCVRRVCAVYGVWGICSVCRGFGRVGHDERRCGLGGSRLLVVLGTAECRFPVLSDQARVRKHPSSRLHLMCQTCKHRADVDAGASAATSSACSVAVSYWKPFIGNANVYGVRGCMWVRASNEPADCTRRVVLLGFKAAGMIPAHWTVVPTYTPAHTPRALAGRELGPHGWYGGGAPPRCGRRHRHRRRHIQHRHQQHNEEVGGAVGRCLGAGWEQHPCM